MLKKGQKLKERLKYYRTIGVDKNYLLIIIRTIRKKVRFYNKKHKLFESYIGIKKQTEYLAFCNHQKIEVDYKINLEDQLIAIYLSKENEHIKAQDPIRGINPSEWRQLKKTVLKIHGKNCLKCGSNKRISIDHIKPFSLYPDLALDINNLQPLCMKCNISKSNRNENDYRKIKENLEQYIIKNKS